MKEFDHDRFERLSQGSEARGFLIEQAREALTRTETDLGSTEVAESKSRYPLEWLPEPAKRALQAGSATIALTLLAACAGGENRQEPTPAPIQTPRPTPTIPSQGEIAGANVEAASQTEPFLKYPVPRDPRIKIQNGWIYENGGLHQAIDYIEGDLDTASTWQSFPVLAAASGEACVNPPHHQGDSVFVRHNIHGEIYYTYYGHLQRILQGIPGCDFRNWKQVDVGQVIGYASSSEVVDSEGQPQPTWKHMHFEVKDENQRNLDPYDLYLKRAIYPDLMLENGRYCGPHALFYEEICPRASILGVRVTARPSETPSPSESPQTENLVDLGNWQIAITSWQEVAAIDPVTVNGIRVKEGWKRVLIKGWLINNTQSPINPGDARNYLTEGPFNLNIITTAGFPYEVDVGDPNIDFSREPRLRPYFDSRSLPPGFAVPVGIAAEVPANRADYQLEITGSLQGNPRVINKGEVVANYDWKNRIRGEVKTSSEPWDIPGFATAKLTRIFVNNCQHYNTISGNWEPCFQTSQEQFAEFTIQNNYGRDLNVSYGQNYGLEVALFLADGRLVTGDQYFYSENVSFPHAIAPGLQKPVDLFIGDVDTRGAMLVLVWHSIDENFGNDRWVAWQLP